MPEETEFISDETVDIAIQMGAYKKTRLGFQIDDTKYHTVHYDVDKKGYYVVKVA